MNLPGSGSQTSGSQTFSVTRMEVSKLVTCGSSVSSKSPLRPYTRVPPPPELAAAGAVVAAGATVGLAAAAGAVVGAVVAAAAGAAVGAAGAVGWQAASPIVPTAPADHSRNSRRRRKDIC